MTFPRAADIMLIRNKDLREEIQRQNKRRYKNMTEITFESGKVFHIANDSMSYWIFEGYSDLSPEEKRRSFLSLYIRMGERGVEDGFKHVCEYLKTCKETETRGYDYDDAVVEDCLFKDVEEFGEKRMCYHMADWEMTMFYVHNGLPVPGGPLPWGDFDE